MLAKPLKIFVSSVQKELANERCAMKSFVEGDPLLSRFFTVFLFEDLPARDRRADAVYLAEVEQCAVYVGILGDEYGFEDDEGVSPTEREFERATIAGKPRLIFVKGTDSRNCRPKMRKLIDKAGQQLIRRRFCNINELTAALYASLVDYLEATGAIQGKISGIEGSVSELTTPGTAPKTPAPAPDGGMVHNLLVRGIGSLYALVLEATFVPFLVFFMLAQKREVWHATLQLFPVSRRTQVKETLDDLRDVLRDYLIGMSVVTLVVVALSSMFFLALGLDYPVLAGIASGIFNMVPYIGAVLAWIPGFMLAIIKWRAVSHFASIAFVLTAIHVIAQNLIAPQLVGRQVRLNAVAITIALLFWGWVWGGMGLILGIPITAALRVICDHTESGKPVARWLGA